MNEFLVYGMIDNYSVEGLITNIKSLPTDEKITLRINSSGGAVFAGFSLYNFLRGRGNVAVIVDGLAASSASVVALPGETITLARNSLMMIHSPTMCLCGDAADYTRNAMLLENISHSLGEIYSKKMGLTVEAVQKLLHDETWFTADQALIAGLCTSVEDIPLVVAEWRLDGFKNVPEEVKNMKNSALQEVKNEAITRPLVEEPLAQVSNVVDLEAVRAEAKAEERARIRDVRAQMMPGCDEIIAALEMDGKSRGADAAVAVLKHLREQGHQFAAKLADGSSPVVPLALGESKVKGLKFDDLVENYMATGLKRSDAIVAVMRDDPDAEYRK